MTARQVEKRIKREQESIKGGMLHKMKYDNENKKAREWKKKIEK